MRRFSPCFPDRKTILSGLSRVLGSDGTLGEQLVILERRPVLPRTTYPVEIVTCRLPQNQKLTLFCKYEAGCNHDAHGHRGGVTYEAQIYREVLQTVPALAAKFYGAYPDPTARGSWLILGFLEQGKVLRDLIMDTEERPQPTAIGLAARWIGRFHAMTAARLAQAPLSFLHRYDEAYYLGWVHRTCHLARKLHGQYPWLERICERGGDLLAPLLAAGPVIIHGEYYESNIVVCERRIYPIDWESAAVAPGEIDLAALTEGNGWGAKLVQQCLTEYKRARWPKGAPGEFAATLEAAKLYLHFRWLGERRDWTLSKKSRWRFQELEQTARRLGQA